MRVRATGESRKHGIYIKDLNAIVDEGFEFDVTEERYDILHGNNGYHLIFVEKVEDKKEEPEIIEEQEAVKEIEKPKKTKKTTKQ